MPVHGDEQYAQLRDDFPSDVEFNAEPGLEESHVNPLTSVAFVGLALFALLLYARPNDLFPEFVGAAPIAKVVAVFSLLFFVAGKLTDVRPVRYPIEVKAVFGISVLAIIFLPLATTPALTWKYWSESWIKVVIIFFLLVNLLTSWQRLRKMIGLVVICASVLAAVAIRDYRTGNLAVHSEGFDRVGGSVGSIFADPNDLATTFNIMLPLAVALALTRRGIAKAFWLTLSIILAAGVTVTLSRGGFLGLVITSGFLWWKLFKGKRVQGIAVLFVATILFIPLIPGTTLARVATLTTPLEDSDGSRQQRFDLLKQGLQVAFTPRRLAVGLGFSNYVEVSFRSQKAHNSYIELLAEMGVLGFALYLTLLLSPLRSLRRIEFAAASLEKNSDRRIPSQDDWKFLSIGLQSSLVAYLVCSFFLSIQYSWYVYYPVAFAVSLRYLAEESALIPAKARKTTDDVHCDVNSGSVLDGKGEAHE
jgi:putative inorganic carbon (hco3(-)) transporter